MGVNGFTDYDVIIIEQSPMPLNGNDYDFDTPNGLSNQSNHWQKAQLYLIPNGRILVGSG